jgi:chromosome segregation ATPase
LREYALPAVRRVFLATSETDHEDSRREMDYLYSRLGQLQSCLQESKEKEQSTEGRLSSIMELWKREQAKCAELQRMLRTANACDSHVTKTDMSSRHVQHIQVSPVASAIPSTVTPAHELVMQAAPS